MGKTFAEKALERKVGHDVTANDFITVAVDLCMVSDTTAPMAIRSFSEMGGVRLADPGKTVMVIDHASPCPNEHIAALHQMMRRFAKEHGCVFFDQSHGVCHQVVLEEGLVHEGDIVLGADSHTCSYGAIGAFSVGVGATDMGASFLTGKTWIKVPESIQIELTGKLGDSVYAKDVILRIVGDLGADGATYDSVEFTGEGFVSFSREEAVTICNMAIEMGAKNGVFIPALRDPGLIPDPDAVYAKKYVYRAEEIVPMVACPHTVDHVKPVSEVEGEAIDVVYLGSCTNGRLSDLKAAADILRGEHIRDCRMIVCPASHKVMLAAMEAGYLQDLVRAGAAISMPGCSLCVGTLGGVPGNGEKVLSTTNRNFKGRMGNDQAFVFLCSPATAAASALSGKIKDPREVRRHG